MKRILFIFLFVPCILYASSINFEDVKEDSNNYILNYKNNNKFILDTNFYGFNESGFYVNEDFSKSGLLNILEYNIIGGKESYLYDGLSYYTMSYNADESEVYEIALNNNGYKYINLTESSGVRYTNYAKPRVKVSGEGTYNNPWMFVLNDYSISYNLNYDNKGIIKTDAVYSGDDYILMDAPSRENYVFVGWNLISDGSGDSFEPGEKYDVKTDTTFYAIWKKVHKVSYDLNGGSGVSTNTFDVIDGENHVIDSIVPTREGYTFLGWSTNKTSTTADYKSGESYKVNSDTVFYAVWKQNKVKINYHVNGGTVTSSTTNDNGTTYNWTTTNSLVYRNGTLFTQSVNHSSTINLPNYNNSKALEIKRTGYTPPEGAEWICSSGCTTANKTFDHKADYDASEFCDTSNGDCTVVLKVNWQINKVNINFHVNGGTVTASTTADNGTVYNWTTSNSLVYLNGSLYTQKVNHGSTVNIINNNNSKYLKVTRTGYTVPDGAEWICSSGCTTANKTFDHNLTYNASDLCDTSKGSCNIVLKVNWQINKVKINYHVNGGTVTATTTADNGTVYKWTTTNSLVYLNGSLATQSINNAATGNLWNYNNSKYLKVTRTGYMVPDGTEWICHSGCTTANKTFDHDKTYNASDFCDTSKGDCTVVVKVNWKNSTLYDRILADNNNGTTDKNINFSNISSDTNGKGLYYTSNLTLTEDTNGDGTGERVYYYRGAVTNNYLYFADMCWRIVRTVEDGSIRLRYGGVPTIGSNGSVTCPQTGTNVVLDSSTEFNCDYDDNRYVGYMYGSSCTSYASCHKNTNNSCMKNTLTNWYKNSIYSTQSSATLALIKDSVYCNDRGLSSGNGYSTNQTFYAAWGRLVDATKKAPTYKCSRKDDKFTKSTSIGNGLNTYPIGLLTADEVAFAGGVSGVENTSYYMNVGKSYWLMSAAHYSGFIECCYLAMPFLVNNDGRILDDNIIAIGSGLLPAISIDKKAIVNSGIGTYNNPYVVDPDK